MAFNNAKLTLTVTSPTQTYTEPVTLAEAKQFVEIPDSDTTRDTLFAAYIVAARGVAELRQGRDLVEKQWDLTMDSIPACIECRDNIATVDLFRYRDSSGAYTTLTEGTDFIVDTAVSLIMPPYGESWPSFTPWPSSAVLVRYTVSPPEVDAQVKQGMLFLISQWYVNRVPVELGANAVQQYPFCLALLDHGRVERV
jgi:uncharacterized phiE125 gp8 family phage protein